MKWQNWMMTIPLLLMFSVAHGDEEHEETLVPAHIIHKETFALKNRVGRVQVLVRDDGHSLNRYGIELGVDCRKKPRPTKTLAVADFEARCFLDRKTLKYDADKEEVTIEGFSLDYALHQKNLERNPPVVTGECDKSKRITVRLSTKNYCNPKR